MSVLRRIWNWFTSSPKSSSKKGHPDLYPIDVELLARELRLAEEAERLGKAGIPAADAQSPSGPEAAVIQRVEKARQDYIDWAVIRKNILSQDIARRNAIRKINSARQADREFDRTASGLLSEKETMLRSLADSAKRRNSELENFRARNKLDREAHYPTSTGRFARIATLLLFIVIEGSINAAIFAEGLDSGLVGGFTWAGILAGINVLVAFFLGWFGVRFIHHNNAGWKLFGILMVIATLISIGLMGLGIAHFRDSLTVEAANPAAEALRAFRENTYYLHDMFSYALFVITIFFGVISLFDGHSMDDPYPWYGAKTRRALDAVEDYDEELHDLREELEEMKQQELKALEQTLQDSQFATAAIQALIDDKHAAASRLATALRDADHALDALLRKFRTENEIHRGSAPRPAYFNRPLKLRPLIAPEFDTRDDETTLAEQRTLVTALINEIQDIRARIQASFTRQFDRLNPLDIHFPTKESN